MEKDLIRIASENIEAFNTADWARLKAPLAPSAVYNEVGTQRRLGGSSVGAHQWPTLACMTLLVEIPAPEPVGPHLFGECLPHVYFSV